MNYIPKQLSKEIREKIEYLKEFKNSKKGNFYNYKFTKQKNRKKAIEENSRIHSFKIEHPNLAISYTVPRNKKKALIKEGIKNIRSCFKYGLENFDSKLVDESFIKALAFRIIPKEDSSSGETNYRTSSVTIKGSRVSPPDHIKVREKEMPYFCKELKKKLFSEEVVQQIESGIFAHFHIARIHPFYDGNGRLSRVLQDIILYKSDIPLPIIKAGERTTYYNLLEKACKDWKENNNWEPSSKITEGERDFYTFIVGKVNVSLDCVIEGCNLY